MLDVVWILRLKSIQKDILHFIETALYSILMSRDKPLKQWNTDVHDNDYIRFLEAWHNVMSLLITMKQLKIFNFDSKDTGAKG